MNAVDAKKLEQELVALLRQRAPSGMQGLFMNCELHETPGGMTNSHDVFAVVKRLFGSARRVGIKLDAPIATALNALARLHMQAMGKSLLVIDLLIHRDGRHQLFIDAGPPRRLGESGDDFFKAKHKDYIHLAPWLALVG